jgi:nicotinamide-nucleotide amidase
VGTLEIPFDRVEWGITSRTGMNVVRFVGKDGTEFPAGQIKEKMNERFGESLLSPGVESCEEEVLRLLAGKGLTLAVAESCTGGLVSKRITDIPGSSKSFIGAVVAYADEAKKNLLDVPPGILHTHGAVSEETARAMALGALQRFSADCALSVTGIAGPGGGTPEKPAGTVCFGTACGGIVETFTRNIIGDRERVRAMASQYAMDSLRRRLK